MIRNIGGALNYSILASMNRPTDPAALRDEVRRLAREQHLSPRDISVALRINLASVHEWLAGIDHAG